MKRLFVTFILGFVFFSSSTFSQTVATDRQEKIKLYSRMGFDEKIRFVALKSDEIMALFGRTEGDEISPEGLQKIRSYLDAYTKRSDNPASDGCAAGNWAKDNLISVLKRGSQNASMISEEFTAQNLPSQIGIYLAMIESEFCPCLQSPTGALGMFQFGRFAASAYGLKTEQGATPQNPDERCQPRLSARAASKNIKQLVDGTFGRDAVGFPLSIGAYNRGEGTTKRHITDVASITNAKRISFWVLLDTSGQLRAKFESEPKDGPGQSGAPLYLDQFNNENGKYVPKFFAAAIIGENPKNFGAYMLPLSQTK